MPGNRRHIPEHQKRMVVGMTGHMTHRQISQATKISVRTIERTASMFRRTGRLAPAKGCGQGRPRSLNGVHLTYLESMIERQPDMTLSELADALDAVYGVEVDESTIHRSLRRRGYSRKHVSRKALEATEIRRAQYLAQISQYSPDQLVFLDESACNRHTAKRTHAWARIGDRARRHDYFVRGIRYSILPAISLDGLLHVDILTRSWNAELFEEYLDTLLDRMNQYPLPNSVVVMDNASVHHFDGIRDMIEGRGRKLVYLAPYSPDFNPIEEGFSSLKSWVRRNKEYVLMEMSEQTHCNPIAMLLNAVGTVMSPENIEGWYRDSRYIV